MFRLRLTALVAAVMFLAASPAFAQSFTPATPQKQTSTKKIDFSGEAAGLRTLGDPAARAVSKSAIPFHPPQAKKPVMKRPLTWAIIAAAAVAIILLANGDGYDSPGGY